MPLLFPCGRRYAYAVLPNTAPAAALAFKSSLSVAANSPSVQAIQSEDGVALVTSAVFWVPSTYLFPALRTLIP